MHKLRAVPGGKSSRPAPPADLIDEPSRLLTVAEWAGLLRVSETTARDKIREGAVKTKRQGRAYRIPLSAHREYVKNLEDV